MKTLMFGFLAFCATSWAQTNFGTITFTNKSGMVFSNATVVRIDANKLIWRLGVAGGVIKLADLPDEVRARFGYNPVLAASADRAESERRSRQLQNQALWAAEDARRDSIAKAKKQLIDSSRTVAGKVIQKLPDGLLVDSGAEVMAEVGKTEFTYGKYSVSSVTHTGVGEGNQPGTTCLGLVLLQDHPRYSDMVDGAYVKVIAYPIGQYQYTTVQNASKTVRKFSADLDRAFAIVSGGITY